MKNEKVAKGRIIGLAGPCFGVNSNSFYSNLSSPKALPVALRVRLAAYGALLFAFEASNLH